MNADSRSFIRYAALRSCLRGIALFALCASRNVWAQAAPGADENVLDAEQPSDATDDEAAPASPPLPRKAKRPPPAPEPPLRSRDRIAQDEKDAPLPPGAVRIHIETPVPAALYDVGTHAIRPGKPPPDSQLVCHSPCDAPIDVSDGQVFSVWAPNTEMSKPFTLREDTRAAVVSFDPGPSTVNDFGTAFAATGAALVVGAGAIFLYGIDEGAPTDGLLIGTGVTLGAGTLFMLVGLPMLLAGRDPEVTVQEKPAGEAFAIDRRPKAVAPRPWLGEF